ncbi:ectoine/hydroxyectoine ABC transporter permease subunit EhuC [Pigmentiphaga sp.]|jgi:ectoine/hydroxyectoine ABC transporter, permease protein EhuC|uniref:ectoine/hydroxyectoine ABC transporter permease subunit EhuC n=1 Tax=Pigmentiphaga sp. TaxID=1977564 RepID=UPI0025CFE21F|nr:ectoine/hydroxyectoine ABC transporter permease subunit EhuC [Pigmentiphaga sp.]MBX6319549.1 ectoine/hydroxyectoine ABC transporter permease subunit EhuC [Pigmentiphaga sp.]
MTGLYDLLPPLLRGLGVTLVITGGAAALAVPSALVAGLCRLSHRRWVAWPAACYVEVFRGTSALVQLFWVYYVLPLLGVRLPAMWAGILVLGLHTGAYGAEIVRGAIASVPRGQTEAARALNMTPRATLWRVVLPQAVSLMLPPAGNLLIELLKNTALVSLITITDLTFSAQLLRSETFRTVEVFCIVLVMYFLVAQALNGGMRLLERRANRYRGRG